VVLYQRDFETRVERRNCACIGAQDERGTVRTNSCRVNLAVVFHADFLKIKVSDFDLEACQRMDKRILCWSAASCKKPSVLGEVHVRCINLKDAHIFLWQGFSISKRKYLQGAVIIAVGRKKVPCLILIRPTLRSSSMFTN